MGRRGPPPLPTAIKKARGTHQKCRDAPNALELPPGAPPQPAGLDKAAKAKWNELVPKLLELQVLSELDGQILETYCRTYSRWLHYVRAAEKQPLVKTPFGPKVNPAAAEARKWETLLNQCGDRLGLSPASRSRVSAGAPAEKDDPKKKAAAFLFGGAGPALQVVKGGAGGA